MLEMLKLKLLPFRGYRSGGEEVAKAGADKMASDAAKGASEAGAAEAGKGAAEAAGPVGMAGLEYGTEVAVTGAEAAAAAAPVGMAGLEYGPEIAVTTGTEVATAGLGGFGEKVATQAAGMVAGQLLGNAVAPTPPVPKKAAHPQDIAALTSQAATPIPTPLTPGAAEFATFERNLRGGKISRSYTQNNLG